MCERVCECVCERVRACVHACMRACVRACRPYNISSNGLLYLFLLQDVMAVWLY